MERTSHAEDASSLRDGEQCWFLPVFGVYHPKTPGQIRGVFLLFTRVSGHFFECSAAQWVRFYKQYVRSLTGVKKRQCCSCRLY